MASPPLDHEASAFPETGTGPAGHPEIDIRIETLSPWQAGTLLAKRRPEARVNASAVETYRLAMISGRWIFNGAPIILSRSGVLLDGVQRLAACVAADRSLTTAIARDVDDEVLPTIDQRRRRPFAAMLAARGVPHARAQAALTEWLIRYDDDTLLTAPEAAPAWGQLESALRANPGIEAAVVASLTMAGSPLPEPARSFILYAGRQVDASLTMRLLEGLRRPERFDPSEPGVVLRAEIDRLADDPATPSSRARLLALSIKALNALLRQERPRRIAWLGPGTTMPEPFPRLDGYAGLAQPYAGQEPAAPPIPSPIPEGLTLRIEIIDERQATSYLQMGTRDAVPARNDVEAIVRDLATGRWKVNAQPICFSRSGRLLDGRHRLMAIIAANATVPVLVVHGLPEEAAGTFDHHTQRSTAVRHPLGAFGDAALAAAMANLLWRREHRNAAMRAKKATPAEVQQILDRHPRLLALRGFGRRMIAYGRASVMGYSAYVVERDDQARAEHFLRALETGANLAEGHPVLALRDQMQRLRREQATQDEQLEALLEGWQRFKAYHPGSPTPEKPTLLPALSPGLDRTILRDAQPAGPVWPKPAAAITVAAPPRSAATIPVPNQGRALRQQILLASFSRAALRGRDLPALLRDAARIAAEGSGTPFSRILRYEAGSATLLLREGTGWRPESLGQLRVPLDPRYPATRAFTSSRPTLYPPPPGEARALLPPFMLEQGVRRSLDVPIPGSCGHFGVLGVDDTACHAFTSGDLAFLDALACILGLSIDALKRAQRP